MWQMCNMWNGKCTDNVRYWSVVQSLWLQRHHAKSSFTVSTLGCTFHSEINHAKTVLECGFSCAAYIIDPMLICWEKSGKTPLFIYCSHVIDCSVQCAIETKLWSYCIYIHSHHSPVEPVLSDRSPVRPPHPSAQTGGCLAGVQCNVLILLYLGREGWLL